MRPEIIQFFAKLIEKEIGIVYDDSNAFQLERRLVEVAGALAYSTVESMYEEARISVSASLKTFLLDIATNKESSFFRDKPVFDAIEKQIIPELLKKRNGQTLRVWSAATSYGQEPYSLAMLLSDLATLRPFSFSIEATDVSDAALEAAHRGEFNSLQVQRGLPIPLLIRHFEKNQDTWKIKDGIRSRINFRKLNLLDPFTAMGPYDLILCRNVLIYQNTERKRAILDKVHSVIAPDGVLLLGGGENMLSLTKKFQSDIQKDVILYRPVSPNALAVAA